MTTVLSKTRANDQADPQALADTRFCQEVIARHSKSFALASRLLSAEIRSAAVATYAWCRRADDAVDHAIDHQHAHRSLEQLRAELDSLDAGQIPDDPVLRALARVMESRRLPTYYLRELLTGMEMDVRSTRYDTIDELTLYCHRVAGVVGLMMCHVLGIESDLALAHAASLGTAMQLTNICRDVDEDWRRGRCYIPTSMLTARAKEVLHGPPQAELPPHVRQDLVQPIRSLLDLAEQHYRAGDAGLVYLDRVSAWAIHTARLVYSGIGDALARQGYDVGAGRAFVTDARKKWLAISALTSSVLRRHPARSKLRIPGKILKYPVAVDEGPLGQRS
jgi:phytoene synthase